MKLKIPIDIFYGTFDPVVVKKHIVNLAKEHENITAKRLIAGHEILGTYAKSLAAHLGAITKE